MWLKKNKPEVWDGAQDFFDLADFLTFKVNIAIQLDSHILLVIGIHSGIPKSSLAIIWNHLYCLEDYPSHMIGSRPFYSLMFVEKALQQFGLDERKTQNFKKML